MMKVLFRERLALVANKAGYRGKPWDLEKVQPEKLLGYQKVLNNKLDGAKGKIKYGNLEDKWGVIKESTIKSAEEVIGKKEDTNNEG